ncbi:hypothetical protein C5167_000357 [Papaver somniferum]|uniref:Uncharacterized protein n=1 Tax=Papaver somniferum TaxID=3469 RepID=A0A4Y7KVY7_PAPSO|nr:hypothetical protein C5167_000357 [Papaver somniferum]
MEDGGEEGQRVRRGRGPTTLKFLYTLQPGQRLQVESWLNSPVGPNSTYLTTYISHIAKDGNKLPLTVSNWTHMPAVLVLNAILEVKESQTIVKKEGFYKYTTQEERLANRPKDVVESQWGLLVEYWQNPHQEEKCAKAKASKFKQTVQQSRGSKPYLEAKLKRPPTAQEICDATHAKRKVTTEQFE